MEKYCKFCGKKLVGRSMYCNLREKKLFFYYKNKGLSEDEIRKSSSSILELADVKGKPYKAERMDGVSLPINAEIREKIEKLTGKKVAEFLRNELSAYLCLPEDKKKLPQNLVELDKSYTLLLTNSTKKYLKIVADHNLRSVKKELMLFMHILNDKLDSSND